MPAPKKNLHAFDLKFLKAFISNISVFHPNGIPTDKPYNTLSDSQKEVIDKVIGDIFFKYRIYEDFKKEIIDKDVIKHRETKNGATNILQEGKEQAFINKI